MNQLVLNCGGVIEGLADVRPELVAELAEQAMERRAQGVLAQASGGGQGLRVVASETAAGEEHGTQRIEQLPSAANGIIRRKAIDHHRARNRRAIPSDELPELIAAPPPETQPELWDAVGTLPPKMRTAVWLRYAGALPHREVADVMDSSEDAARKSVSDGLKKLKEALA